MRTNELNKIDKLLFSIEDISKSLSISKESAKVTANRYVKQNFLIRVKRNYYITASNFEKLNEPDLFRLANLIQVPSYISLTCALSFYGVSTQQLQDVIESISLNRTKIYNVKKITFQYFKLKKPFYSNFIRNDNIFIATVEKSLADAIYLTSIGKYNCDFDAVDFSKINKSEITNLLTSTNEIAINFWSKLCKRYKI